MDQVKYQQVMSQLKVKLKELKISYALLANTIDVPESTIKKWFTSTDGSFNRIVIICNAIGIPLASVLKSIEEQELRSFTFTKNQQTHFLKDQISFKVYWLMVYERKPEAKIMADLKLGLQEMKKIIFILDRLNLIQLGPNEKIKLPRMKPIHWKFSGRFMEELFKEWTNKILEDAQNSKIQQAMTLQFYQLSEKAQKSFQKELMELEEKYARLTILELNQSASSLKKIRYLRAAVDGSYI